LPRKLIEKLKAKLEVDPDWEKKRLARVKEDLRTGKAWGKTQTHAICKSCKGQCCYLSSVVLDCEAAERRLHEFSGDYDYSYNNTAAVLRDLGRKNTKAPILKKREDGSCIYFDRSKRRCTIYRRRPKACKVFFCGRGTRHDWSWKNIRAMEKSKRKREKNKEAKMRSIESMKKDAWKPDREMPMLDAILAGQKLWNSGAPALVQKQQMKKVAKLLKEEHDYMLEHEPQDQFHACTLLGALNLVEGLLCRKKPLTFDS
jgi:Fe-S-cluster containining protein